MDEKKLESALRDVIKTGKYVFGTKEAVKSIKGSRLVVAATTARPHLEEILNACTSSGVPLLIFPGSSSELGRVCGKPFRISAIVVKSPGEASLEGLTS